MNKLSLSVVALAAVSALANAQTAAPRTPQSVPDVLAMVHVDLDAEGAALTRLRALGFDVPFVAEDGSHAEAFGPLARLDELRAAGLRYELVSSDVAGDYERRLAEGPIVHGGDYGQWLSPPFGQGAMGGYYTFDQVVSVLDQMRATYPNLISVKQSVGTSLEGRDLWMVKVSDNPDIDEAEPEVRFDSLHHAREPEGMQVALWFLSSLLEDYGTDPIATYLVNERELFFVPVVNPDGYVYNQTTNPGGGGMWRKNRRVNSDGSRGVDLNRNYPYEWGFDNNGSSPTPSSETYRGTGPASEPEVAAMVAFIDGRDFTTALSIHTYSNLWLAPWGYDDLFPANNARYAELGELATEVNGYPYGPVWQLLYNANGGTLDYDHGAHGTMCWSPEIGDQFDGFWPAQSRIVPLAVENRLALLRTAWAGGPFVLTSDQQVTEVGDGDGNFEAGESVEIVLTLRNSGVLATGTPLDLTLSSSSPGVTITQGLASLGSLASFTSGSNAATPLAFTIGAGAPAGEALDFVVTIQHDGFARDVAFSLTVGEERPYIVDAVEFDFGWVAGAPGDGATTGLWERDDPIGTDSNGQAFNPENDATPGAGHLCFVTGNGGGSAGNDDVDGGPTTLLSPPFDLSQVANPHVSYARWYAVSASDDTFEVDISNDDGQNWTPLERLTQNANAWTEARFRVADYLTPTATMRLRWRASDDPNNSLVEAAVDDFRVTIYDADPRLNVYGAPALGTPVQWNVSALPGDFVEVWAARQPGNATLPGVNGTLLLNPNMMFRIATGTMPGGGLFSFSRTLPSNPVLIGTPFYFQAIVTSGGVMTLTNRDELVFE